MVGWAEQHQNFEFHENKILMKPVNDTFNFLHNPDQN